MAVGIMSARARKPPGAAADRRAITQSRRRPSSLSPLASYRPTHLPSPSNRKVPAKFQATSPGKASLPTLCLKTGEASCRHSSSHVFSPRGARSRRMRSSTVTYPEIRASTGLLAIAQRERGTGYSTAYGTRVSRTKPQERATRHAATPAQVRPSIAYLARAAAHRHEALSDHTQLTVHRRGACTYAVQL